MFQSLLRRRLRTPRTRGGRAGHAVAAEVDLLEPRLLLAGTGDDRSATLAEPTAAEVFLSPAVAPAEPGTLDAAFFADPDGESADDGAAAAESLMHAVLGLLSSLSETDRTYDEAVTKAERDLTIGYVESNLAHEAAVADAQDAYWDVIEAADEVYFAALAEAGEVRQTAESAA